MTVSINTLKDEIDRTFMLFGPYTGFKWNKVEICRWKEFDFITREEFFALREYNRERRRALLYSA